MGETQDGQVREQGRQEGTDHSVNPVPPTVFETSDDETAF